MPKLAFKNATSIILLQHSIHNPAIGVMLSVDQAMTKEWRGAGKYLKWAYQLSKKESLYDASTSRTSIPT